MTHLDDYAAERDHLLQAITTRLERDPRVAAAWLWGSFGRGENDKLSDLDLWVVVEDSAMAAIAAEPLTEAVYADSISAPILIVEAPQNAPVGGAYLAACYDAPTAPHLVDWYWQPLSNAFIPAQVRVLFDRAGLPRRDEPVRFAGEPSEARRTPPVLHEISFFWMMLMITAKHIARFPEGTRYREQPRLLPYVVDALLRVHGYLAEDPGPLLENLPRPASALGQLDLLRALAENMEKAMGRVNLPGLPAQIAPAARSYLDLIKEITQE